MSELIVGKAGGTSNSSAESVAQSMNWAEQTSVFVVSAPGKVQQDPDSQKVTDLLLEAQAQYISGGEVPSQLTEAVAERYNSIVQGVGGLSLPVNWVGKIPLRVEESARQSKDAASMLGERLQAEIYQAAGYTLLDPARSPVDLGSNPEAWATWLSKEVKQGKRYVLPGNTTKVGGQLQTFSRGGSDISGGLAAYGVHADLNLNLTDDSALSTDPRLIQDSADRLKRIKHLLYEEGRELGRNGTGLVHPAAMVPLMIADIPTEIRSTFNSSLEPTLLDNDTERAERRTGQVMALSLMEDVTMHRIYEPGMAEAIGRLAAFETALSDHNIAIVDSQGDGVDGQRYFVNTNQAEEAASALRKATQGTVESTNNLSFITLVGYRLERKLIDNIMLLALDSGVRADKWQQEGHDLSFGRNSLRISVKPEEARTILDKAHRAFVEGP